MSELNEHEKDKLLKILRNAYIELCRAEKLLRGCDDIGKRAKLNTDEQEDSTRTPRNISQGCRGLQ